MRTVLAGGLVLGIGTAATVAAWTDEEHVSTTLTAGTFSIVGSTDGTTFTEHATAPGATLAFTVTPTAMLPGTVVYAPYSVKTAATSVAGTVQLAADAANGQGLGAFLTYGVTAIAGTTCSAATFASGTSVVPPGAVPTVGAAGTQSVAAAGASVAHYCFAVTLPSATSNAAQGTTVTLYWIFGRRPDDAARHAARGTRHVSDALGTTVLDLAALGGLVCIVLVVLAVVFNLTLIMFRTGSMGPGIPAGSVALVHKIPASEIRVGDLVTVDRAGVLPISHRVMSVAELTDTATRATSGGDLITDRTDARVITMRGDANAAADPAPYTVTTVRVMLGSLPGLAVVVVWFSNPGVLLALTLAAASLVTWAFWPRSAGRRAIAGREGAAGDEAAAGDADATSVDSVDPADVGAGVPVVAVPAALGGRERSS